MQTVSVNKFTRGFAPHRRKELLVTDRGRVIGTWTPVAATPQPVDIMARLHSYCSEPLPFAGAEIVKASRKR